MTESKSRTPEGALLGAAIKRSGISRNQVAAQVDLSSTQVANYISGFDNKGSEVNIPPLRLAKLAALLGISEDEIRDAGRDDAARVLASMKRVEDTVVDLVAQAQSRNAAAIDLAAYSDVVLLTELLRRAADRQG